MCSIGHDCFLGGGSALEHSIPIVRHTWNDLQDMPVLNDLNVFIEPEDINPGILLTLWTHFMVVENNVTALCKGTLERILLSRMLFSHVLKIFDERLFTVCHVGIVLDVICADIALGRLTRLTLIKHQIIEYFGGCFVLFQVLHTTRYHRPHMRINL